MQKNKGDSAPRVLADLWCCLSGLVSSCYPFGDVSNGAAWVGPVDADSVARRRHTPEISPRYLGDSLKDPLGDTRRDPLGNPLGDTLWGPPRIPGISHGINRAPPRRPPGYPLGYSLGVSPGGSLWRSLGGSRKARLPQQQHPAQGEKHLGARAAVGPQTQHIEFVIEALST
jgi:hypothetical protein